MKRQDSGRPRSRLEHGTPEGDAVMFHWRIEVVAPNDEVSHYLNVIITVSNALSVDGSTHNEKLANEILDNAMDAIRSYHSKKNNLVVPGRDVQIDGVSVKEVRVLSDMNDEREYTTAVFLNAKEAITNMHLKRKAIGGASEELRKIEI